MGLQRVGHDWASTHRDIWGVTVREGTASAILQSTGQLCTPENDVAQTLLVKVKRPWRYPGIVLLVLLYSVIPSSFSLGTCALPVHFLLRLVDGVSPKPYSLLDGPSSSCLFSKSASTLWFLAQMNSLVSLGLWQLMMLVPQRKKFFCCFITFEIKTPKEL